MSSEPQAPDSETLAEQVQRRLPEPLPDVTLLVASLDKLQPGLDRHGWQMNPTQRLALATHLAATVRRFESGELLDPMEPSIFTEVPEEAIALAADLLAPIQKTPEIQIEEKFLVAVHLAAAQVVRRKK